MVVLLVASAAIASVVTFGTHERSARALSSGPPPPETVQLELVGATVDGAAVDDTPAERRRATLAAIGYLRFADGSSVTFTREGL